MEQQKKKNTLTDLLRILITVSSVLGIAGFFLHDRVFFLIAGGICAALVVLLSVFSVVSMPAPARPIYLVHGTIFLLLLVIGCLVAETLGDGLLLGTCLIGISIILLAKLLDWVHSRLARGASEWFDKDYAPYDEDEEEVRSEIKPILLDEGASQTDRIEAMSVAFNLMSIAFDTLEESTEIIWNNKETMESLARYMDSGLWKEDFEAVERGDISPTADPFGVLSEDGLYNLLEDSKAIMKDLSELTASF